MHMVDTRDIDVIAAELVVAVGVPDVGPATAAPESPISWLTLPVPVEETDIKPYQVILV